MHKAQDVNQYENNDEDEDGDDDDGNGEASGGNVIRGTLSTGVRGVSGGTAFLKTTKDGMFCYQCALGRVANIYCTCRYYYILYNTRGSNYKKLEDNNFYYNRSIVFRSSSRSPPSPLNLQPYQSPEQRTHQLQHVPLPLPVPSNCEHINHSSNALTYCNTYTAAPSPLNLQTCQSLKQRTHLLQHVHCRSQFPQPANISITQASTHQTLINTHLCKA
ncbi:hypothetical protein BBBOND_0305320 [Babesia bigemina]|uniref:Uncharacterized protein n=1 Tax=Babesia bigemina TaxID=5866 RepID=A0A061DCC3_BABBI|nr:hypothetical protein BBBOND_0305320 [Babesia bigemina]CDR96629.1 hypothetical protein BBBOND_0305320 [Babesia bigemina]|eukprot:XP_012768815.1 hypothetical protein BBBOND_0305320 [Babesia bigemina]